MANPNIAAATSIVGHTIVGEITTSLDEVLDNQSATELVKVNSIVIINDNGSNSATVSATISDAGGTGDIDIAKTIPVPAGTNLVLISADMRIYLTQDKFFVYKKIIILLSSN